MLLACRSRHWQAAKILFNHGASALYADVNGQMPLQVAVMDSGVELLASMASRQQPVFNKLREISSLSVACQFHYNIFSKIYPRLSDDQIGEVVTQVCRLRNTDVLQHTGQSLGDDDLLKHIT